MSLLKKWNDLYGIKINRDVTPCPVSVEGVRVGLFFNHKWDEMKPITVKELIEFLREQDQNTKVEVFDGRLKRYVYDIHDQTLITTKRKYES